MKKKRCKALTIAGKKCRLDAMFDGYCVSHCFMFSSRFKKMRFKKIRWRKNG